MDSLPLGAHLTTPRRGYLHHGLYAGDGRVIHYGGFSRLFRRRPVEEVSIEQFTRGRGLTVKAWVAPKFAGAAAVERARSRLGENRYRLWTNNCEHFTEWCLSGTGRSLQVEQWKSRARGRLAELVGIRARVSTDICATASETIAQPAIATLNSRPAS
jgi:HRAS-like suppressor 3